MTGSDECFNFPSTHIAMVRKKRLIVRRRKLRDNGGNSV
jgi:hypothetical protein